jgi:hypothetical protein
MNPARALQLFTIAYFVLGAASVSLASATEQLLPEPLRSWEENRPEELALRSTVILAVLAGASLVAIIAGSVGLLLLKKWGAWMHLAGTVLVAACLSARWSSIRSVT